MIQLFLARHGVTDWNEEHRYVGHSDQPLNAQGEQQASQLAHHLRAESLAAIYSSDLQRALSTAETVAHEHSLTIQTDERLREMNFGLFEGLTYDMMQAQYAEMASAWFADPETPPTGGESLSTLAARVSAALSSLIQPHSGKTLLIVAHGGSLRVLLCHLLGMPVTQYWRFDLKPCALMQVNLYDSGGVLMRLNDDSYLGEPL